MKLENKIAKKRVALRLLNEEHAELFSRYKEEGVTNEEMKRMEELEIEMRRLGNELFELEDGR